MASPRIRRRTLLLGGLAAATGIGLGLRPRDRGASHAAYFEELSRALDRAELSTPSLVIDRQKMLANLAVLQAHIAKRYDYRIVAKSLPSIPMLETIMQVSGSDRLMLFHQPFLSEVARRLPHADVLMGKPMPVQAAANFYRGLQPGDFQPQRQLQWLVDTPRRLQQYRELAEHIGTEMRISVELDVGLHRGGVQDPAELVAMLKSIQASPALHFGGLMGYEPHLVKVPGKPETNRDKAIAIYQSQLDAARQFLGANWPANAVLNCAGSPTYQLYTGGEFPCNELAAGSCLVKPTDFDIPTLADHQAASYIATPVLKALDRAELPGPPGIARLMALWNPNRARSIFTYGGYWKAKPESPPGLTTNPLFGRSTNQELLNGSRRVELEADDWVFLRPQQSEFVFLQFGDIAVYEQGNIVEKWPVLGQHG